MNLKDQVTEFVVDGTLCLISYFIPSQACLFRVDEWHVVMVSDAGPFPWSCLIDQGPLVTGSLALFSTASPPFLEVL